MSKYGVFSGLYFAVFGLNTGKYGPEITPYLDTFHAMLVYNEKYHSSIMNDQKINFEISKSDLALT